MKKYRPSSCMACGGKKMYYQVGGMHSPVDSIEIPHGAPDATILKPYGTAQQQIHNDIYRPKKLPFNLEQLIREGVTAGAFISGIAARNRDQQYEATQDSTLGQRNAMPSTDFQPNAYSLYAKYGGSLKHHILKPPGAKFSNDAWMNMGDPRQDYDGKMQVGGLTRGLIPTPSYYSLPMGMGESKQQDSEYYRYLISQYQMLGPEQYSKQFTQPFVDPRDAANSSYYGKVWERNNKARNDAQNVMTPEQIQAELHRPLATPADVTRKYRGGGNWIPKDLHKGRCTPAPNPDCPVGSPQYNLAQTFKKHHGFHKKK